MVEHVYGKEKQDVANAQAEALSNALSQFDSLDDVNAWIDGNVVDIISARTVLKHAATLLWSHEKRLRRLERG
jgi:hypothetical protein